MVIEDESILTTEEKEYIKNIILGERTPFYWVKESVLGEGRPWLMHLLIHKETQQIVSPHAKFFKKIAQRFAHLIKSRAMYFLEDVLIFLILTQEEAECMLIILFLIINFFFILINLMEDPHLS